MSDPVSNLAGRVRGELGALFDESKPVYTGFAPQSIDVIGGLLVGHGGARCAMPIDRYATVLAQPRIDGQILIFDFDEYDQHRPFTLQISANSLLSAPVEALMRNLGEPGRAFAGQALTLIRALGSSNHREALLRGLNVAVTRDVGTDPDRAGSEAMIGAMNMLLAGANGHVQDHPVQRHPLIRLVVESRLLHPDEPPAYAQSRYARIEEIKNEISAVELPDRIGFVAVACESTPLEVSKIDIAARMAHRLILEKMRAFGQQAGRELISDPMGGQIGNLGIDVYKRFFRGALPETMRGEAYIAQFGFDGIEIDPTTDYAPQFVADHLVIEAHRVREFVRYLREAQKEIEPQRQKLALDRAGHLLYASHASARESCGFGHDAADLIVDRVRANETAGLYGAALSPTAGGPWVSVLCRADAGVEEVLGERNAVLPAGNYLKLARIGSWESSRAGFLVDFDG